MLVWRGPAPLQVVEPKIAALQQLQGPWGLLKSGLDLRGLKGEGMGEGATQLTFV